MYEQVIVNALPNRPASAYHRGDMGIPDAPKQFAIFHKNPNGEWRNIFESDSEQQVTAELVRMQTSDAAMVETLSRSKKPEIRAQAVPAEFKIVEIIPGPEKPDSVAQEIAQVAKQIEQIEEKEEAVEASSEIPEVTPEGKFEVTVEPGVAPHKVVYRGNSPKAARAAVAAWVGKCVRVSTRFEGVLLQFRAKESGYYWDRYEQYCADMRAGKFDAAFERDWQESMATSEEARLRHFQDTAREIR